jgi:hypothetical protein
MRNYAVVAPRFWNGLTGRAIRAAGRDAQVLALYLFTGPSATMMGLYYLPLPTLCHEAGFTPEEARAALAVLQRLDFAYYDEAAELVWVPQAAAYQIGEHLKPGDKRRDGVEKVLAGFLGHPFGRAFLRRYKDAYSLRINVRGKPMARASEAPPKPGTGTETGPGTGAGTGSTNPPTPPAGAGGRGSEPEGAATGPRANGHGTGLRGIDLDAAVAGLVAHWRRLGSFDPASATGWATEPATIPREQNVRAWRRALRTGRVTVEEFHEGITNRVHDELMKLGKLTGYEEWPPTEGRA